jgi:hypothetical protein
VELKQTVPPAEVPSGVESDVGLIGGLRVNDPVEVVSVTNANPEDLTLDDKRDSDAIENAVVASAQINGGTDATNDLGLDLPDEIVAVSVSNGVTLTLDIDVNSNDVQ